MKDGLKNSDIIEQEDGLEDVEESDELWCVLLALSNLEELKQALQVPVLEETARDDFLVAECRRRNARSNLLKIVELGEGQDAFRVIGVGSVTPPVFRVTSDEIRILKKKGENRGLSVRTVI